MARSIHETNVVPPQVEQGRGLVPAKINPVTGKPMLTASGQPLLDYDMATPNMLLHFFPTGILGLGLTALLASFMSGMAGNVTAFNTVFTYDLYQSYIHKGASDRHYMAVGRWATVGGILLSICDGLCGHQLQQHHGHAATGLQLRQRAAVRHLPAGHVLEARHRPRCIHRPHRGHRARPCCTTA